MKEEFYLQRIWSQYYKKKMERVMKTHRVNEAAFRKMRACAGNMDVKDMVRKFLSRETTYQSLLENISQHESKFEQLRAEEETKNGRLQGLRIEYDNKRHVSHKDERDDDRRIEYELKQDPIDNPIEKDYKRLSDELF